MPALTIVLALLALFGHAALWVGFVNRVHATGMPRGWVKLLSIAGHALLVFSPLVAAAFWLVSGSELIPWLQDAATNPLLRLYFIACWIIAVVAIALWIHRRWLFVPPKALLANNSTILNIADLLGYKPLHGFLPKLLSKVPGNQALTVSIDELHLALPRLPSQLDGLSIVQLSDLHMIGKIGPDFFKEAVRQAADLRADMIVITGDIVDEVELFDWIPQTLGQLSAPLGVYFVLGNHDQFTGAATQLRQILTAAGMIDLGARWHRLEHSGATIVLAGNELPWFTPVPDLHDCPQRSNDKPQLRLLLSHSPDQWSWARRNDFDLMLAGHAHGGQIRIPLIGPIFCPSRHGVKYASGTFYREPTLMHVSRGLSAELPLRLNCPPELTKIVLRRAPG
jgi:uncharacterized protein